MVPGFGARRGKFAREVDWSDETGIHKRFARLKIFEGWNSLKVPLLATSKPESVLSSNRIFSPGLLDGEQISLM
jgi:hypothetical protein